MLIKTLIYIGIAVLIVIAWVVLAYNNLIRRRYRVKEASSDIDVQAKRRYDLIPNLLEAVKGYMQHEQAVLENVTNARAKAMSTTGFNEKAEAENVLANTLKTLFAVSENYPDLKASVNFLDLQRELADTENKMQAARRFYNSVTQEYNAAIAVFPKNIIANIFKFTPELFFEITDAAEKEAPKIKF